MTPKRYISYFPNQKITFNITSDQPSMIITHSLGLINALIYCSEIKSTSIKIIAIDPPDISLDSIKERFLNMPYDLKEIYKKYLDNNINISHYNVYLFRNIKNLNYLDTPLYKYKEYYKKDTHYPYEDKLLRQRILSL